MNEGPTALYRYRDEEGRTVYVGITGNPDGRDQTHVIDSAWHSFCSPMEVEWFGTLADAQAAERLAIRTERPLFNQKHGRVGAAIKRDQHRWLSYRIRRALGTPGGRRTEAMIDGRIVIGGDEDNLLITLFHNGGAIEVSNTNHDEHGYDGMVAARNVAERLAAALRISVVIDR